ncbi:MAG TPA: hypothetical protein VFV34_23655 [Blastocatellia bacterium]|nr:hypothetical protein [Blastocatellia bacterium]
MRNKAYKSRVFIGALPLAFILISSRSGVPVVEAQTGQQDVVTLTIDPTPQITGAIGGGVRGSQITPMSFTDTISFGELSPINTNPVVRIARTCTATTGQGITEIRLSVPALSFSDPDMLQYSDIGVGIQNVRRTGGGCAGVITAAYNNDPSTTYTVNAAGRATYPASLANLVSATGVMVIKLRTSSTILFDVVFACVPSYYTPGSSSFVVTVAIVTSSGNPCA